MYCKVSLCICNIINVLYFHIWDVEFVWCENQEKWSYILRKYQCKGYEMWITKRLENLHWCKKSWRINKQRKDIIRSVWNIWHIHWTQRKRRLFILVRLLWQILPTRGWPEGNIRGLADGQPVRGSRCKCSWDYQTRSCRKVKLYGIILRAEELFNKQVFPTKYIKNCVLGNVYFTNY